ncbi:MAG: hypothetical protein L0027_02795 [Candidatus Rokubacteria bacterium]|nr:hypothetical protein [Candidatus Rokubacteria bacterium]
MRLVYDLEPAWPPLAWLAVCRAGEDRVGVRHGRQVETTDEWFAEAAWAGDYEAGDLDRTDLVAGSGGRLRGREIVFVSSGSTVDRLQSLVRGEDIAVSNSLPCLLAAAGATLDPSYPHYYGVLSSVVHGLRRLTRSLPTSAGPLELIYFENLAWDGRALTRRAKPGGPRDFSIFARYREFLESSLGRLAENLGAKARLYPYRMLGTLSSGYDSSTVAALARQAGCEEVLCFDRAWGGRDRARALRERRGESDSRAEAARVLGLRPISVPFEGWRSLDRPEIPFLAANGMGEEVRFRSAEPHLPARVLLTGYHGDKMWAKTAKDLGPDLVRGDPSGSALGEYRLWVGFLHCPVPFWGVRQIADVHAITRSPEMAPWDLPGPYSRPICRRIVEGAGVPREMFGMRKLAASVMLHDDPDFLTPASRADYLGWLGEHRGAWLRRGAIPPVRSAALDRLVLRASDGLSAWMKRTPGLWRLPPRLGLEYGPTRLRRALFPWAVERAMARYASARGSR